MTELEQARAHLQVCQQELAGARLVAYCLAGKRRLRFVEEAYLAALSWVWDAQERARAARIGGVPHSIVLVQRHAIPFVYQA